MLDFERPNIEVAEISADRKFGRFVIEPLERGYGLTLGNSLRRIMLSSLPGAAVSQVKIDGVLHEFTTLPGVKEDITEIVMNIKSLAIRNNSETDEAKVAIVEHTGEGVVTAKDIQVDQDIEIMNPDQVIATLSGGVDSSVCAVLLHKAIGKRLTCVFVDHGCMRLNEAKEVKKVFKGKFGINLIQIDAEKRFLDKAKGITDPELKRKCIGGEFIRVFEEEAKKLGEKIKKNDFTLDDFLDQLQQVKKLGSMQSILGMLPGLGKLKDKLPEDMDFDSKEMRQMEAIIKSMTKKERADIGIVNGSRRKRIAAGSGRHSRHLSLSLSELFNNCTDILLRHVDDHLLHRDGGRRQDRLCRRDAQRGRGHDWPGVWHDSGHLVGLRQPRTW